MMVSYFSNKNGRALYFSVGLFSLSVAPFLRLFGNIIYVGQGAKSPIDDGDDGRGNNIIVCPD